MSELQQVWNSSTGLIQRFFGDKKPTLKAALTKLNEELDELKEELFLMADGATINHDRVAKEAADVFVTLINTLYASGVTAEAFTYEIACTVAKNDAKTHETHYINAQGLIARKPESEAA